MDFSKFFSWSYYFSLKVGPLSGGTKQALIIILSIFLLLAFVSRLLVYLKKEQVHLAKLLMRFYIFWLVNAVSGFIWLFFRAQAVPLFGARFWVLILLVVDIIWLFYLVKYAIKQMPKEKKEKEEKEQFRKYLPK